MNHASSTAVIRPKQQDQVQKTQTGPIRLISEALARPTGVCVCMCVLTKRWRDGLEQTAAPTDRG